jgi:hypothetical protein
MQYEYNNGQNGRCYYNGERHPGDPFSRAEIELPLPWPIVVLGRHYYQLGVRDDAFDVDEMFRPVLRRAYEQVFNVVVCASETKERVWRLKCLIRRLGQLSNCRLRAVSVMLTKESVAIPCAADRPPAVSRTVYLYEAPE